MIELNPQILYAGNKLAKQQRDAIKDERDALKEFLFEDGCLPPDYTFDVETLDLEVIAWDDPMHHVSDLNAWLPEGGYTYFECDSREEMESYKLFDPSTMRNLSDKDLRIDLSLSYEEVVTLSHELKISELHKKLGELKNTPIIDKFYELKSQALSDYEVKEYHRFTDDYDRVYALYVIDEFRFHCPVEDDEQEIAQVIEDKISAESEIEITCTMDDVIAHLEEVNQAK